MCLRVIRVGCGDRMFNRVSTRESQRGLLAANETALLKRKEFHRR